MKKRGTYLFVIFAIISCGVRNEDIVFLRPNEDVVIEKIENGEIVAFGNEGLKKWVDHTPIFVCEANESGVCFERWIFSLNEYSLNAINSMITEHSNDRYYYSMPVNETNRPTDEYFTKFRIVNVDYNNFEFQGSVFSDTDGKLSMTIDYYYPICQHRLWTTK